MLAIIFDFVTTLGAIFTRGFDVVLAAGTPGPGLNTNLSESSGAEFASKIRAFVGPIVLLIVSLIAISFLFKRQLTQFFQFVALAVVVAVLFYVPGVIENIAGWLAGTLGGGN